MASNKASGTFLPFCTTIASALAGEFPVGGAPVRQGLDRPGVGKANAPEHQQHKEHGEQRCSGVDARIALQVHKVGSDAVAFDDTNANQDGPNGIERDLNVRTGIFSKKTAATSNNVKNIKMMKFQK